MFYIDEENNIFISKGDTAVLDIELYKGDNPLYTGTKKELADYLGVNVETISFYASPTYKRRNPKGKNYLVFRIEDDDK